MPSVEKLKFFKINLSDMLSKVKWHQWVLMAGGALAAGGTLWYILRDDAPDNSTQTSKINVKRATEAQVEQVLDAMLKSQDLWRKTMKTITAEAAKNKLSLNDVYERVQKDEAEDALEQYGITMEEFDKMLENFRNSTKIREKIAWIMDSNPGNQASTNYVSAAQVVEVHTFMANSFHELLGEIEDRKSHAQNFDLKSMALALQIYVAAKVEEKYHISADDMELAVMTYQQELMENPDFQKANHDMQCMMNRVFGPHMEVPSEA